MKLYSWTVHGIAAQRKGFLDWFHAAQPDVLCLQRTLARHEWLDAELLYPPGYHSYWVDSEKKGYSGVGLYSKTEPKDVRLGLGIEKFDSEGRTIIAEYDDFTLITGHFPISIDRWEYYEALLDYANDLRAAGKSVVFVGDIKIAHQEIDLAHPGSKFGFRAVERAWIDKVIGQGYIDIYRTLNPNKSGAYTYWYSSQHREQNHGHRWDMFFISPDLRDKVAAAEIHADVRIKSRSCPISLTFLKVAQMSAVPKSANASDISPVPKQAPAPHLWHIDIHDYHRLPKVEKPGGYVYVIQDVEVSRRYKIGLTNHPAVRLNRFDVVLPFKIELVHIMLTDDTAALERYLHRRYAEKRKQGEWFDLTGSQLREIFNMVR